MLEIVNRYAHGYVAIPAIVACANQGLFGLLGAEAPLSLERIARSLNANSGHLRVAVRMLESLNWVERTPNGAFFLTAESEQHRQIPSDILDLFEFPVAAYLSQATENGRLLSWIRRSQRGWNVSSPLLADMLDGLLVIPVFLALKQQGLPAPGSPPLGALSAPIQDELADWFLSKGWAEPGGGSWVLTASGQFLADRCLITATTASYRPMLANLAELLGGDPRRVFQRDEAGHESHIDRALNVIGSGFQHGKFFADLDDVLISLFDQGNYAEQPHYLCDTGCGDGSLLRRCYEAIRDKTDRGRVLDRYPLRVIGVDFNGKALEASARTLAGIPHWLIQGDIGDPEKIVRDLRARGLTDPENILHLRSFLDHDRPYQPPVDAARVEDRARLPYQGVYVDEQGQSIAPAEMVQSLVEHLQRWSDVANRHGLILLEVHCLTPELVRRFLDHSESLHFDAYHAFSKQYLVEAEVYLTALAEAGLFARPGFSKRYPRAFDFTRISLHWLEPRPYRIRPASPSDIPRLLALEAACWLEPLRATATELERRMARFPDGQFVLLSDGQVVGAAYCQRITAVHVLQASRRARVSDLYAENGPILQLLALNVLPELQDKGLGDQLLEFLLQWCALKGSVEEVVGITRCRDYRPESGLTFEDYAWARNRDGRLLDPVLRFHEAHGATLRQTVPDYWPIDPARPAPGVLIHYAIRQREPVESGAARAKAADGLGNADQAHGVQPDAEATVEAAIRSLLGKKLKDYQPHTPLRELGMDSLDLMELRYLLNRRFGEKIDTTFFFRCSTPAAIADFLSGKPSPTTPEFRPPVRPMARTAAFPDPIAVADPRREPIAIVGMSCRFPGAADLDAYWRLLQAGVDAITPVPPDRGWTDETGDEAAAVRFGGFLEHIDRFDAAFFRISAREANALDPQQRLILELCWQALEQAAIDPHRLAGSQTGIFVGAFSHDYEILQIKQPGWEDSDGYFASGNSASMMAGRLAYLFDFRGPALTVETACSSSLVALHLACQSLRDGDCELALAGGVNLMLSPELSRTFAKAGMLAADGRCKTFDAAANGYVRSEGVGVVVLKRLSRALADNDPVMAVVRATAVNQDGASNGLTAPNPLAQEAVIRRALQQADVTPHQIDYVEAHGTGTALGDPVEVKALGAVYGQGRVRDNPLLIGSVKTNIGHAEAAAGIAGLIKTVLALQHRYIPPHLHFANPNPGLDLAAIPAQVPAHGSPWPAKRDDGPRLAGVSSFGFSGTNAHVILEQAPPSRTVSPPRSSHLLALSARSETALASLARSFGDYLQSHPAVDLAEFCHTANSGRAHFDRRLAAVADTPAQLRERLIAFADGENRPGLQKGQAGERPRVVFMFTGQGSQFPGMARELYETQPVFRDTLDRCAEYLGPRLETPLLACLYPTDGEPSPLDETAYTQPALFALEYALAALWRSWGIEPDAVLGHSVGEYVAACVAGVFSLEDGLALIAERGRVMQALPRDGAMIAVLAPVQRVADAVAPFADAVSIAAVNGPASTVISGARAAVEAVASELARQTGCKTVALPVSHAFHSPLMEPVLAPFADFAGRLSFDKPRIPLCSNVSAEFIEELPAAYWVRHIRAPVRFGPGLETVFRQGYRIFLEIGPQPVLTGMARAVLPTDEAVLLASLNRGASDWRPLLDSLGTLYTKGAKTHWAALDSGYRPGKLHLPGYPFQRKRHWFGGIPPLATAMPSGGSGWHPLLGRRLPSAVADIQFETRLNADNPAYLRDHRVGGRIVVPAAAFLEMALAAAGQVFKTERPGLEAVTISQALVLSDDEIRRVQCIVTREGSDRALCRIYSLDAEGEADDDPAGHWRLHASARLLAHREIRTDASESARRHANGAWPIGDFYARIDARRDIRYGVGMQGLTALWNGPGEAVGRIEWPPTIPMETGPYRLHPVLLDAALQVALTVAPDDGASYLPVGADAVTARGPLRGPLWSHVLLSASDHAQLTVNCSVFDEQGEVVCRIDGLILRRSRRQACREDDSVRRDWLYRPVWRPQAGVEPVSEDEAWPESATLSQSVRRKMDARPLPETGDVPMESLCIGFIWNALGEWVRDAGEREGRFATSELADRAGIDPRHRRLLERLLSLLDEAGWLRREGDRWTIPAAAVPEIRDLVGQRNDPRELARRYPHAAVELDWLARCAPHLGAVLTGRQDPLALLFPAGDAQALTRLYQEAPPFAAMNEWVAQTLSELIARRPPGRPLRVLEIGAGTGATSAAVLPHLADAVGEYVFTDISPLFTRQAEERFGDYPFVRGQVLDIERSPIAQGFAAGHFDVVLAANVLHATRDLKQSLDHVRELLKPGGWLVLLEVTESRAWLDLTFGLLDGWWRFADRDLRPAYPLLSADRWRSLLDRCGFAETTELAPPVQPTLRQAVIVARRPMETAAQDWLVLGDRRYLGNRLADILTAAGHRSVVAFADTAYAPMADNAYRIDPRNPEDFRRLLQDAGHDWKGVVHLWSLDNAAHEGHEGMPSPTAWLQDCESTLHLLQALAAHGATPKIWLVTRGAQAVGEGLDAAPGVFQASLWGMGKVVAQEAPELACKCIDLDPVADGDEAIRLWAEIRAGSNENQIAFRRGQRHVARLASAEQDGLTVPRDYPLRLAIDEPGNPDSLSLQAGERRAVGADDIELRVRASGLNFLDVMDVLGALPFQRPEGLGEECVGEVVSVGSAVTGFAPGDRVMALANGALAQTVVVPAALAVLIPSPLNWRQAATIPVNFATAAYALRQVARLAPGERILIHAAAGGTGLAAVQLAQRAGAEIFATASPEKWDRLRQWGVRHVMNSRDLDFADEIGRLTEGQGVDVVLNSLTGDFIPRSLALLRAGGRFLELGKSDRWSPAEVAEVNPLARYYRIDLRTLCREAPERVQTLLRDLAQAFRQGELRPLPVTPYPLRQAVQAFRTLQQARHVGKLVIVQPPPLPGDDGTYLITGGFGGLGLQVAHWLAGRGVRHLVLLGRRAPARPAEAVAAALREQGVHVQIAVLDVADGQALERLFATLRRDLPPLRGVFHAAGTLDDGVVQEQTVDRFAHVMAPKVLGAWHLHRLTRDLPLHCFVLFSSVASLLGSAGQANHAAANAFLDSLASFRRAQGLAATAINWGAWSEVGAAAGDVVRQRMKLKGLGQISPAQGLAILEDALRQDAVQVGVLPVENAAALAASLDGSPFCSELATAPDRPVETKPSEDLLRRLESAPVEQRRSILNAYLQEQIAQVLGLDAGITVPINEGFFQLGMDSLTSVELRNRLQSALNGGLPSTVTLDYPTVVELAEYLTRTALADRFAADPVAKASEPAVDDALEALSESEAEERLLEKLNSLKF
ncbi:MAG: SDR family NAD(P)-dependent oxidoreductase [Gammaproteobacteria bacterium]|nr:SDR family NAD(P)-dependent oxidoreductase [Gammaproteobacteria bacterium]